MTGAATARTVREIAPSRRLYDEIGIFLTAQRLEPDPANYAFAHAILGNPEGPLARAVSAMTDGGIRLTMRDIETLGCEVSTASPAVDRERADGLVAQTQRQVEGFADIVQELRAEATSFGRDLAASADAIARSRIQLSHESAIVEEVERITAAMVERVRTSEAQLEQATIEAAELRTKLDEAREDAKRDPLTELPNRRAFEETFASLAAAGTTMWLAVCDVDHFKQVNDRFGHSVGDRVLKAIGGALLECCGGQFVARYGGEEFVVLFADVDGEAARATLETARTAVAAKRYRVRETDAPLGAVTFSAGLTAVADGEGARTVFGRADKLLYQAKREGRDRVRAG